MCTPSLAIDCIIEFIPDVNANHGDDVVLVFRGEPPKDKLERPQSWLLYERLKKRPI